MLVETVLGVVIGEGEIVAAAGVDDTLGELSAGAGSIMVSTMLKSLVTTLEMIEIESLPRRVDYDVITIVG